VTVSLRDDSIVFTDDGDLPDGQASDAFFDYGGAVPDSAAGMTLPDLRILARTLGWDATIDTEYDGGARTVVSGVTVSRPSARVATRG